jgi:hypothetical protein
MTSKGHRVREFFEAEAQAVHRKFRIIETLIPAEDGRGSAHSGEEGRHIESLLRDFLNRHLPLDIRAFSGFIVCPATKLGTSDYRRVENEEDRHSSQLDIIVYDTARYPVYERFEEFVIVPPEGVVGIISVKKRLRLNEVARELINLERACVLCHSPNGRAPYLGLFAFSSDEPSAQKLGAAIFKKIDGHSSGKPYDTIVTEVSVFDKLVAFKFREQDSPRGTAKFVRIDAVDRISGAPAFNIALQRMLQSVLGVYYDPRRGAAVDRPGFVSFYKGQFKEAPLLGLVKVHKSIAGRQARRS